jgi:broad specificity phosphatase PhoE
VGEICLVRHGQASFGAADYDQLSQLGVEQSRRLGAWLAASGQQFDRVVTGTLRRHRQTADECLALHPHSCARSEDAGLNEYDHREMLCRYDPRLATPEAVRSVIDAQPNPRRAFQELFTAAFARWVAGEHDAEYGESFAAFRARVLAAIARLVAAAERSERLIVFTSGGPIAVIAQSLLGLADERVAALNFSLANAALTTAFFGASGLRLGTLNAFQHLQLAGERTLVTYR